MRARSLYFAEMVAIGAVIALGAVWPSLYTVVALMALPAFFLSAVGLVRPGILRTEALRDPRRPVRLYLHGSAAAATVAVLAHVVWTLASHSTPLDIVVPPGTVGPVRVLYGIEDGDPVATSDGRRRFEFTSGRILATQAKPDDGWWREEERRFFVRNGVDLRQISGRVKAAGSAVVGDCAVVFEDFIIEPSAQLPEATYREIDSEETWGLRCEHGRLTRR